MIDYRELFKQAVKENAALVLNELNTRSMQIKIANWADKFGYSEEEVRNKIISDEMFRCIFAKDPSKQNLYQKIAADYIKNLTQVSGFKVLPQGGGSALYVIGGRLLSGGQLGNTGRETKSVDFTWVTNGIAYYASHKYTREEGGAQDNQYRDVKTFLENCRDCHLDNTRFLAICDGEFYQRRDSSTGNDTRIKRLERLCDNRVSFAMTTNDLETFLSRE